LDASGGKYLFRLDSLAEPGHVPHPAVERLGNLGASGKILQVLELLERDFGVSQDLPLCCDIGEADFEGASHVLEPVLQFLRVLKIRPLVQQQANQLQLPYQLPFGFGLQSQLEFVEGIPRGEDGSDCQQAPKREGHEHAQGNATPHHLAP